MKLAYTLHEIRRNKKAEPVGAVIELSEKDFADLLRLGAVREATATEAAIYGSLNRAAAPKTVTTQAKAEAPTRGKKAKDAAPAEKPVETKEAEQSKDPDEVDL